MASRHFELKPGISSWMAYLLAVARASRNIAADQIGGELVDFVDNDFIDRVE